MSHLLHTNKYATFWENVDVIMMINCQVMGLTINMFIQKVSSSPIIVKFIYASIWKDVVLKTHTPQFSALVDSLVSPVPEASLGARCETADLQRTNQRLSIPGKTAYHLPLLCNWNHLEWINEYFIYPWGTITIIIITLCWKMTLNEINVIWNLYGL